MYLTEKIIIRTTESIYEIVTKTGRQCSDILLYKGTNRSLTWSAGWQGGPRPQSSLIWGDESRHNIAPGCHMEHHHCHCRSHNWWSLLLLINYFHDQRMRRPEPQGPTSVPLDHSSPPLDLLPLSSSPSRQWSTSSTPTITTITTTITTIIIKTTTITMLISMRMMLLKDKR